MTDIHERVSDEYNTQYMVSTLRISTKSRKQGLEKANADGNDRNVAQIRARKSAKKNVKTLTEYP